MILFGAAGESDSFRQQGYKNGSQMPLYLKGMGLDAFEYQCGRGVRVSEKSALPIRQQAQQQGIVYSLHAPYYISMSSLEEEKRLNSVDYILQSARAIRLLGGSRTGKCQYCGNRKNQIFHILCLIYVAPDFPLSFLQVPDRSSLFR